MKSKHENNFEGQMQRLQEIVELLEKSDLPLEKSVALYKEGRALSLSCKSMLDEAKNEIYKAGIDGLEKETSLEEIGEDSE